MSLCWATRHENNFTRTQCLLVISGPLNTGRGGEFPFLLCWRSDKRRTGWRNKSIEITTPPRPKHTKARIMVSCVINSRSGMIDGTIEGVKLLKRRLV